ncbi:MAG: hypothetical protein Q8N47_12005 [Bryobacterales bacterium]|nr:hypothetical protein [Bryobacterales bacterium]
MKLYSYVVDHDTGLAPNPHFGVCTLCRCKYRKCPTKPRNIVELAEVGDWVEGTGGADKKKSAGHGKLVYAMRVDKKLTREEYYTCPRFKAREDNEPPKGDSERHGQFVLISRHFYYFGAKAITIPFRKLEKSGLGSEAILLQRISADLSNGWRRDTSRGNTANRARSVLISREEARHASRLAESRNRHWFWGDPRPAVQRRFI